MLLTIPLILACAFCTIAAEKDLTLEPGHLKPFGQGRPSQTVEEVDGYISPEEFFEKYVKPHKPLKFKGAAKQSPAFSKWTDDYFLQQDEPADNTISVETKKKEDRKQDVVQMSFKEFVKEYNNSEKYMVDAVPYFIKADVMVPCPLQCDMLMTEGFVENIMWFSSGGTKSVVHTDSVENINCLFRGEKSLVFVNPNLYGDKVPIDHPEGAYSSIDVDSVDYTKYPGLAEVEFLHVNVTAGDCLYIPYKWIHQVRSYGSNLAVNIWWDHNMAERLNFKKCNKKCDSKVNLDDVIFQGFNKVDLKPEDMREHLLSLFYEKDKLNFHEFFETMFGEEVLTMIKENKTLYEDQKKSFNMLLDQDQDGVVNKEDIKKLEDTALVSFGDKMSEMDTIMSENPIYFDQDQDEENSDGAPEDGGADGEDMENEMEFEMDGKEKYFGDSQFADGDMDALGDGQMDAEGANMWTGEGEELHFHEDPKAGKDQDHKITGQSKTGKAEKRHGEL